MPDLEIPEFVSPPPRRRPPPSAVHRRRRAAALLGVAGVLLLIAIVASGGGGSGGGHSAATAAAAARPGFLARVLALGGGEGRTLTANEARAEDRAINRAAAVTPFVRVAGSQHREMALTFDDGPGPYTLQVLDTLRRTGTPATFFVVGRVVPDFHEGLAAELAEGYPIGDHTQDHANLREDSARDQRRQLIQQASEIGNYGAPFPRLFRPPYLSFNATTLKLVKQLGMLTILWTIDTDDFTQPGADAIAKRVLDGARPGAIVLMHDAGGPRAETVAALPMIIRGLRQRGYKLVTVPRLLLDNPPPPHQTLENIAGGG